MTTQSHIYKLDDFVRVAVAPGITLTLGQCSHPRETTNIGPTTDQINHHCPDCGQFWTTFPERKGAPRLPELCNASGALHSRICSRGTKGCTLDHQHVLRRPGEE